MKAENCCSDFREEFRVRKFGLYHQDPSLFIKPQCLKPKFHILWVSFWLLFYIIMLALDVYYNASEDITGTYFIFLTNWSYLWQSAHVLIDFAVTVHVYVRRKDIKEGTAHDTPWYIKVVWIFFNVNNSISILVTLVYYALLKPDFQHGSINKHLLNSVYTLSNLVYCANPVHILHVYQPVIFGCIYLIFTLIYHALGNDPIYAILDWSKPGSAALVACLTIAVGIPVVHLVCFSLYTLRLYVSSKCQCVRQSKSEYGDMKREVTTRDVELQETTSQQPQVAGNASNAVRPVTNSCNTVAST